MSSKCFFACFAVFSCVNFVLLRTGRGCAYLLRSLKLLKANWKMTQRKNDRSIRGSQNRLKKIKKSYFVRKEEKLSKSVPGRTKNYRNKVLVCSSSQIAARQPDGRAQRKTHPHLPQHRRFFSTSITEKTAELCFPVRPLALFLPGVIQIPTLI